MVLTQAPIAPKARTAEKVDVGSLVWTMTYDRTARRLYVFFNDEDIEESRISADGMSVADIRYADDGIPIVCGLEVLDPIRVGVIEDWIIEAAELAMAEFGDDYEVPQVAHE